MLPDYKQFIFRVLDVDTQMYVSDYYLIERSEYLSMKGMIDSSNLLACLTMSS